MRLFFELLTLGLLAGIVYFLQAIAFDFKAILRSELLQVIGELKTANRINGEILAAISKNGTHVPTHHVVAGGYTVRLRRGGSHHIRQFDGEFMIWSWRNSTWQPLSIPPGYKPGPSPEFDGDYEGESISVWLPRPE